MEKECARRTRRLTRARATNQTSVRRGGSRLAACRRSGGCVQETRLRRPTRGRCAWRTGGSLLGKVLTESKSPLLAAISDGGGDRLAGAPAKGHPQPALPGLLLHAAPEFIRFEHIARLARQKRVLARRESLDLFPPPTSCASGSKLCRGAEPRACSSDPGKRRAPAP